MSRKQLAALCRLLEMRPIGPSFVLRFQLRAQLRRIAIDDKLIKKEGINTLTSSELQTACRERGMPLDGDDHNRVNLRKWVEWSMNEHVPKSLLLWSSVLLNCERNR